MITVLIATLLFIAAPRTTAATDIWRGAVAQVSQLDRAFDSKYCRVEYTADKEQDARQLAADADSSLDAMARDLAPLDPHLMDDFACTIVQFGMPQPGLAADGQSNTHSENGGRVFWVSVLARSSTSPTSRTLVGEPKDEDYVYKNIADELSAVLLERVTRYKGKGWYIHQAPEWFVQGIEGYFGLTHSSPHSRDVTLPKYVAGVHSHPEEVTFANGIHVGNPYFGGLVLVAFIYETYGADRVNMLLMSPKESFDEAFSEIFGDLGSVQLKYNTWIATQPLPPPANSR